MEKRSRPIRSKKIRFRSNHIVNNIRLGAIYSTRLDGDRMGQKPIRSENPIGFKVKTKNRTSEPNLAFTLSHTQRSLSHAHAKIKSSSLTLSHTHKQIQSIRHSHHTGTRTQRQHSPNRQTQRSETPYADDSRDGNTDIASPTHRRNRAKPAILSPQKADAICCSWSGTVACFTGHRDCCCWLPHLDWQPPSSSSSNLNFSWYILYYIK